ncbi:MULTISPECIES: potassium channel family protein [Pseudoalteromonas]|uniref:TrkA family potassium uptake protein n=1 Tax=Pseudoalteromonas haloplanktis TaxID=228 RepID=A0ABU1B791_PSEHA|nr:MULTISPECIES: TrkA family potassium uptake protein [Pseudoalteromonas]MCF6146333.1 trk system potassium uptake protein TrkA [Pseudoalteromonas mariniglutinosa NCIMB 1770]MDQ9090283.1 TrkA family potassium uptake protein [Pseudoalteromonas haloplanktis]TMN71696.1 TrkA family potassium uptake protein [Pseudoalteromonas sp. S1727]
MAQFAVIGLGRFGVTACLELAHQGHHVCAADISDSTVNHYAHQLSYTVVIDASDEAQLARLDLISCQAVLVAIGENIEASILCVLHLKNLGVKEIWVKACTKSHHQILSKLGVSRIIHPEEEMGVRVAQALNYPMVNQYFALTQSTFIVELAIDLHLSGRTIGWLLKERGSDIKPLTLRRDEYFNTELNLDTELRHGDSLVLLGSKTYLTKLAKRFKVL